MAIDENAWDAAEAACKQYMDVRVSDEIGPEGVTQAVLEAYEAAKSVEQVTPLLNPDMPAQELRLHLGELTAQEERTARAVIRWANSIAEKRSAATETGGIPATANGEAIACEKSNDAAVLDGQPDIIPHYPTGPARCPSAAVAKATEQPDEFTLLGVLADIRHKTGIGDKPMLSELADLLAERYTALDGTLESMRQTNAALLKRLREREASRQPIETAPKGVPVLVAGGLAMKKTGGEWFSGMEEPLYQRPLQWSPTWWMPIPRDNARRG